MAVLTRHFQAAWMCIQIGTWLSMPNPLWEFPNVGFPAKTGLDFPALAPQLPPPAYKV